MTRLIEDLLTDEERGSIAAVLASNELRFDRLVKIAGLDRTEDFKYSDLQNLNFCGADLRGFDFTGSDLRGGVTDERTRIDGTTILEGAKLQWITERDIPIVQLMQEVQSATSGEQRWKALDTLEKKFGKTDHIISFVVNAAAEEPNLEAYLDYAEFLPSDLKGHHLEKAIDTGVKAVSKKIASSRARTRRSGTAVFAVSTIVDRLAKAEGSFAADWFTSLADIVDTEVLNDALSGTTARLSHSAIVSALEALRPTYKS